jgi:ABC-type amino acid transport substrate-binding protein
MKRQPRFVQCAWDQILPMLDRRDIDLALNGYEFSPERARDYLSSLPYYVYELGLCVRKDNADTQSWDT